MKVRQVMTSPVIHIGSEESVAVASRMLTHYNVGALPVCDEKNRMCGLVTDRDLVIRCMAAGRQPEKTAVRDVMTGNVISVDPEMDLAVAAHYMGSQQVRRLPVVEGGKLCGMVSLGDLAKQEETAYDASDALSRISENLSER